MSKVVEIVNERIMRELKAGIIPWHKPWAGTRGGAYSRSTGKPYSLLNQMLLGVPGEYLTVRQIMEAGGRLKKDEKPSMVVFWKQVQRKAEDDGDEEKVVAYPVLRYYSVYHINQCEGIEPLFDEETLPVVEPDEEAERIAQSYFERSGCGFEHALQNRAYYNAGKDKITLPFRDQFDDMESYHAVKFHEIGHSTGHASRLNRDLKNSFGSEDYSREELVAELVSACAMNMLGLENQKTIRNHAAYIQSWLRALKEDTGMMVWAAGRADKALHMIMDEEAIDSQRTEKTVLTEDETQEKKTVDSERRTNTKQLKAAAAFAKSCAKSMKDRPNLAGAFLYKCRQYITNGYIMAAYSIPFEGLTEANLATGNSGEGLESILNGARLGTMQPLPRLDELRTQFKEAKGKMKDFKQYTKLGDCYFNTEYLITTMELAGVTEGTARMQGAKKPLYIAGDNCEVIVLPIRVEGMPSENVWRPELTA